SMPRVVYLVDRYNEVAGGPRVFFVQVPEQAIMDWQLIANRNGHIACTHGGESLAGLNAAIGSGHVFADETAIVDSTAHALKFSGFQDLYFRNAFPEEFGVHPDPALINQPRYVHPQGLNAVPQPGKPLNNADLSRFVEAVAGEIAHILNLEKRI
ncbi:threonine synthase, partial [Desulfosarcina sp. OttesenSCG-928-B08]|nr:threonine synthase [Desulfosarcina sp. OttesenSCG-928-B08]